jgi:hypothetical protein
MVELFEQLLLAEVLFTKNGLLFGRDSIDIAQSEKPQASLS